MHNILNGITYDSIISEFDLSSKSVKDYKFTEENLKQAKKMVLINTNNKHKYKLFYKDRHHQDLTQKLHM